MVAVLGLGIIQDALYGIRGDVARQLTASLLDRPAHSQARELRELDLMGI